MKDRYQNSNDLSQQISNKSLKFHNEIRTRQRKQMIDSLRKQYQHMYIHHNTNNKSDKQQMRDVQSRAIDNNSGQMDKDNSNIIQQQRYAHNIYSQNNKNNNNNSNSIDKSIKQQIDQYPLHSKTLQKYHTIPHNKIWKYLNQISQHLLQNNIYLSLYMQQQNNNHHLEQQQQNQQIKLIHDLFYLTLQHNIGFKFPRKFKFIHNGDTLVASYVAIVSMYVMPDQLMYWMEYMSQEDKDIVYLGVIGDGVFGQEEEDDGDDYSGDMGRNMNKNKKIYSNSMDMNDDKYQTNINKNIPKPKTYKIPKRDRKLDLHYQTWVNHPILRNILLHDFMTQRSAAKAVRQIVCFRQVHPYRLKNNKGQNLYTILCKMLSTQLRSMRKLPSSSSSKYKFNDNDNSQDSITNIQLYNQHLQICIKVLIAHHLDHLDHKYNNSNIEYQQDNNKQLIILVTKILTKYIQTQKQIITPLFCIWVIDALLDHGIRVLEDIGYQIIVGVVRYDMDSYIINRERNRERNKGINNGDNKYDDNKQQQQYRIYIKQDRFNKFQQYVYKHILNHQHQQQNKNNRNHDWVYDDGQQQLQEQIQQNYYKSDMNIKKNHQIDQENRQQSIQQKDR